MASGIKLEKGSIHLQWNADWQFPAVADVFYIDWIEHSADPAYDTVTIHNGAYRISAEAEYAQCEITTKPALRTWFGQNPDKLIRIVISNGTDDGMLDVMIRNGSGAPLCVVYAANLERSVGNGIRSSVLDVSFVADGDILISDSSETEVIVYYVGLSAVMAKATAVEV